MITPKYGLILKQKRKVIKHDIIENSQLDIITRAMEWYYDASKYYNDNKINHKFIAKDINQNRVVLKITTSYL